MLKCAEVVELVTDYLEGHLSLPERLRFRYHVGLCRNCRAYLRQMRLTVRTLGSLPRAPIPEPVLGELMTRFQATVPKAAGAPSQARPGLWSWLGALLLVVVAAALGLRSVSWVGEPMGGALDGCLLRELGAGLGALALAFGAVRLSRGAIGGAAMVLAPPAGAFAVFVYLTSTCPLAHSGPHAAVMHVGGVLVSAVLATAAASAVKFRSAV
jgi:predicted anti-sigma-YlaC factor YlaD